MKIKTKNLNEIGNLLLFLSIIVFFLFGCRSASENKVKMGLRKVIVLRDSHNRVIIEQQYISDSIKDGYLKEYFENGAIKHLAFFKKNEKDSIERWYFPNGHVKEEFYYIHNLLSGPVNGYYPNGKTEYLVNFAYGKKVGNAFDYFENEKLMHFYYYDSTGGLRFKRTYNVNGRIVSDEGHAIINVKGNKLTNTLLVGDTFFAKITTVQPPQQKSSLMSFQNRNKQKYPLQEISEEKNSFLLTHPCQSAGKIQYKLVLYLEDSTTRSIDSSYYVDIKLSVR